MKKIVLSDNREVILDKMKIMGIINATPDSFYPGSRVSGIKEAVDRAKFMVDNGAKIIDIGGESTRPGAMPVNSEEETERIIDIIKNIKLEIPDICISVDTYNAYTAEKAVCAGADIINDISGMTFDPNMINIVKEYNVPIVIMHTNDRPSVMQDRICYKDVLKEVYEFLYNQMNKLTQIGINKNKIIIDPGIGFGKLPEQNLKLIKNFSIFNDLGAINLIGVSRKGFIRQYLKVDQGDAAMLGSVAIAGYLYNKYLDIVRVHDVYEHNILINMMYEIDREGE